jgi:hypothetical protein
MNWKQKIARAAGMLMLVAPLAAMFYLFFLTREGLMLLGVLTATAAAWFLWTFTTHVLLAYSAGFFNRTPSEKRRNKNP